MNTKERVIKFLLSKEREYNNNKLSVDVGRNSFVANPFCQFVLYVFQSLLNNASVFLVSSTELLIVLNIVLIKLSKMFVEYIIQIFVENICAYKEHCGYAHKAMWSCLLIFV